MVLKLLLFAVLTYYKTVTGQENQCTTRSIGTDRGTNNVNRDDYFYLNTAAPSDCWGTITSFSYCYYAPRESQRSSSSLYRTNFGVYRPSMEGGARVYTLVSGVFTLERSQAQVDRELDFVDKRRRRSVRDTDGARFKREYDNDDECLDLSFNEPVTVNPGDVLGACVFDPPGSSVYPLDVVRSASSSDELLRADSGSSGCTDTAVPSSITSSSLSTRTSRVLHLHATIGKNTT